MTVCSSFLSLLNVFSFKILFKCWCGHIWSYFCVFISSYGLTKSHEFFAHYNIRDCKKQSINTFVSSNIIFLLYIDYVAIHPCSAPTVFSQTLKVSAAQQSLLLALASRDMSYIFQRTSGYHGKTMVLKFNEKHLLKPQTRD